jgi:hypothetical protein
VFGKPVIVYRKIDKITNPLWREFHESF